MSEAYRCNSNYVPMCLRRSAPPVFVDPRIAQAAALNNLGRQALDRKDFAKAADYFGQANVVYPDNAYRQNLNLALSAGYFQRGEDAYLKRNWSVAIAEFQRSLSFGPDAAATENIKRARSYQAWDYGIDAWRNKNYDLAITYFQQADSWWHDPKLADLIREATASKFDDAAVAAMNAKNFALAETLFSQELSYAPDSKYALSRRADAIAEQARALAQRGGGLDAVIGAFDRAFQSYDAARAQLGGNKSALVNYAWARKVASALLVKLAKSDPDWASVVAAHRRWFNQSGSDSDAASALSYVNDALSHVYTTRAGQAVSGHTAQDFQRAQSAAESALRIDPSNAYAGRIEAFAKEQNSRVVETTYIVDSMKASANSAGSKTWPAFKQAVEALHAQETNKNLPSRCPWDTAGCEDVVAPDKPQADGFLPVNEETPEQRDLHAKIDQSATTMKTLVAKLEKSTDVVERAMIKQEIINTKSEADTNKENYDEITKAHRIQKR